MLLLFCRCNNVMYIRGVEEEDEEGEMKDWITTCHTHHPAAISSLTIQSSSFIHLHHHILMPFCECCRYSCVTIAASLCSKCLSVSIIMNSNEWILICFYNTEIMSSVCQCQYEQWWVNVYVCESVCTTRLIMIIYWIYSSGSPIKSALLCGTVGSNALFVTEFKNSLPVLWQQVY